MNNNDIQRLFEKTRNQSIKIIENLSSEDMNIQSMEDASPIKWHLAHTTWSVSYTHLTLPTNREV